MTIAVPLMPRRRKRLDAGSFDLPAEELRRGSFTQATALWARDVLIADGRSPVVTVQFSSEQSGMLGGIDEAIATLKRALAEFRVEPIFTTIPLHADLMRNSNFINSEIDIHFVERLLENKPAV